MDGEQERQNPYEWYCAKHGSGYGPIDECPQCMKEADEDYRNNIPNSICWGCRYGDEPGYHMHCHYDPKLESFKQKPRKKHCKHFKPIHPEHWEPPIEYDDPEEEVQ